MGLFERRSSKAGLEDTDQSSPPDRHDSGSSRRPSSHHTFPFLGHSSNTSRVSSAKTSSSSLQALNEDAVTDARSEPPRNSLWRKPSQHFEQPAKPLASTTQPDNTDLPVYPDQSYASLQSQVHPPPYQPSFLSRGSYSSYADNSRQPQPQGPRTVGNTPISSPGLFNARSSRSTPSVGSDDDARVGSPYLHPTHLQPPKETHTAEVDRDIYTGNKLINDYEILEELGRGEHGKVKLGRHLPTKQQVAIKIVQRYSKRRRLGKLGNPEDKVKKEVAILKKARHPNVVSLLEVIDDPNRQKVYIVLEYVENGEIKWRKKGVKEIVQVDKRRLEREKMGIPDSPSFLEESLQYVKNAQRQRRLRQKAREKQQAQLQAQQQHSIPAWSLEHGGQSDDELGPELSLARTASHNIHSPDAHSSPGQSYNSSTSEFERRMQESSLAAIEGSMYGAYASDYPVERRYSTASSMFGYASSEPDWLSDDDDMSYVPCLTISEARNAFRDAVLGLEYLHYQGIIHRDIKPANLLVTSTYRVKISDFGVSYLGRPIRDDDEEQVTETDATELDDARGELSKTVGTPAFYAPELCYTGDEFLDENGKAPKITGAIDIWSLGVTLYGMIFGRLPFVSDDEYSLFQTIGKKEVFIPSKRLKPVEADPSPSHAGEPRVMNSNKRMDDELAYEDIDDTLRELLQRLLTKDPNKRITIKEIKHHPWVLQGLPNPQAWIEETDPSYQSKGKRIEVSNEEVTTAVSKVPFIERVRSNVARWSGYIVGRRDSRRRRGSVAGSTDPAASSKDPREGRRSSLRGDEEVPRSAKGPRESEHPLSQSITASLDDASDGGSCCDPDASKCEATSPADRTPRPHPPDRAISSADSTKTVRPLTSEAPPPMHHRTNTSSLADTLGSHNFGSLFSGAGRRLAKGFHSGEWRAERSCSVDTDSVDGDARSEPSLALSVASATGQFQSHGPWRVEGHSQAGLESNHPGSPVGSGHRRHRSWQLSRDSSAESFQLAKEVLLRQAKHEKEPVADDDHPTSRVESETYSNGCPPFEHEVVPSPHEDVEWESCPSSTGGLTTSPPSAVTISSSSVDDYTSGMSQSASHPSIPSVMSGASSLSGDGFHVYLREREKESEQSSYVPPLLRTGDTITAKNFHSHRLQEDEYRYDCDDEDGESDDEGIVIGRKKPPTTRGKGATT
ncbi:hypothetical protein VTN77DRAFT_1247 [Rasamsonia byssochlamydoides]|uniref:uncharacterized protein n=1 Tax=Rasamsonia byssochlamydoides TaxID=89139 RepID=UPI0037430895